MTKTGSLLCTLAAFASFDALADSQQWWFDIEVILFSHDSSMVEEHFSPVIKPIDVTQGNDLLGHYLSPDLSAYQQMFPVCGATKKPFPLPAIPVETVIAPQPADQTIEPDSADTTITDNSITPMPTQASLVPASPQDANQPDDSAEEADVEIPKMAPFEPVNLAQYHLTCRQQDFRFGPKPERPWPDQVPVDISGNTEIRPVQPTLLSDDQFELNSLFKRIARKSDLHPLLHIAWRQQVVFGRDNAQPIHLFAGKNYSQQFDYWGNQLPPKPAADGTEQPSALPLSDDKTIQASPPLQDNIVKRIEAAIADTSEDPILHKQEAFVQQQFNGQIPSQVWQLDGLFKVYLQYNVAKVPYLHIDSHFNYRQPGLLTKQNPGQQSDTDSKLFLYSYPFDQLRQVVSTQVHYFDHPYFGMIVQIRRYKMPPAESESDASLSPSVH